jgi:protein-S-isoprenylcysteine O-methyltransferase Ste14
MTLAFAKSIFVIALVIWGVLRYPHQRRSSKIPVQNTSRNSADWLRISCATLGLGIVPLIYVATGFPRFASYEFMKSFAYAGTLVFAVALWLFYLAHQSLGRNFSVSLDVRKGHVLISNGVYGVIRHPIVFGFLALGDCPVPFIAELGRRGCRDFRVCNPLPRPDTAGRKAYARHLW